MANSLAEVLASEARDHIKYMYEFDLWESLFPNRDFQDEQCENEIYDFLRNEVVWAVSVKPEPEIDSDIEEV